MKKTLYISLVILFPLSGFSQTLFRSGIFLHHSTGLNIWGPNNSSTSIVQEMDQYNAQHNYAGQNAVDMDQQWFPTGGNNEWEYWHRIFDFETPEANIQPILTNNKIVVIKSCFDSSEIIGEGEPDDTLDYALKTIYNYKWHWRHIIHSMAQHPDNFFVIWTNAPLTMESTNPTAASLSKQFTTWAKDTLAQGLDAEMGDFPANVYVFHYFNKVTDNNGYEELQYAISGTNSHPNENATALIAPQFVNEIFTAAIAYEQGGATLSVNPVDQIVESSATSATYAVTSNSTWTTTSDQDWFSLTPSGTGNGELTVTFDDNPSETRSATIMVTSDGLTPVYLTLTQQGAAGKLLHLSVLIQGLYAGNGMLKQASDDSGAHFGPGIADQITVELHNAANYNAIAYTFPEVELSNNGSAVVSLPTGITGSYRVTVKHRNSVETTTISPLSFDNPVINCNLLAPSNTFGNNLIATADGFYAIYGGDINQDGTVDTGDMSPLDNDAVNFVSGYLPSDVNCDGMVDTADMTIVDNNAAGFVSASIP